MKIFEVLPYKTKKKHFWGTSDCLSGVNITEHPWQIHSCVYFEDSTNCIRPAVQEIWKIRQFCHYKAAKNNKLYF